MNVPTPKARSLIFAVAACLLASLAACSQGLSEEDVESRAREMAREMAAAASAETAESAAETPAGQSRLQRVRDRGAVACASNNGLFGFGYLDDDGNNVGFDIDLCRAVAAAVLGDPDAISIHVVSPMEMGVTIQSGEVDLLVRTVTASTSREAQWGNFTVPMYYDGQGFIVRKELGLTSALEMEGASVCVAQGTTTELNLQDFSNLHDLNIEALTFDDTDTAVSSYQSGRCDSFTTDHSGLFAYRAGFDNPDDHAILPDTISEEPLAPAVPHGDENWYDVVQTVMGIIIYAEAYGISSDGVPTSKTGDSAVDRLLGLEGSFGQEGLGLKKTVAQDVIRAVGNYGELYERHLGSGGVGIARQDEGRNALWSAAPCADCPKGGQIYSVPLR